MPVAAKGRVQDALRQAATRASSAVGTVFQVRGCWLLQAGAGPGLMASATHVVQA